MTTLKDIGTGLLLTAATFLTPIDASAQKKKKNKQPEGPQSFKIIDWDKTLPNDQVALVQQVWFDAIGNNICDSTESSWYNIQLQAPGALVEIDLVKDKKDTYPTLHAKCFTTNGIIANTDEIFFKDTITGDPKDVILTLFKSGLPFQYGPNKTRSVVPVIGAFIHFAAESTNPAVKDLEPVAKQLGNVMQSKTQPRNQ
jgi:hypothetical protein